MSDFAVTLEVAIMETIEKMVDEQSQGGIHRSPVSIKHDILTALEGVKSLTACADIVIEDEDLCDE